MNEGKWIPNARTADITQPCYSGADSGCLHEGQLIQCLTCPLPTCQLDIRKQRYYDDTFAEQTRRGMEKARTNGKHIGRPPKKDRP